MSSSFGDIIHQAFRRDADWEMDVLEHAQSIIYKGMHIFTIFMVAFFFLFLYYCAFGFIVGAIAEPNIEDRSNEKTETEASQ